MSDQIPLMDPEDPTKRATVQPSPRVRKLINEVAAGMDLLPRGSRTSGSVRPTGRNRDAEFTKPGQD